MNIKNLFLTVFVGLSILSTSTMANSDLLTPEILWSMHRIGSRDISRDGKQIVYSVSTPDIQKNKSRSVIFILTPETGEKVCLTLDEKSESEPAFVGEKIAFLSGGDLWLMDSNGENRTQLTNTEDIEGFSFAPDGKAIVLVRQIESTSSIQAKEPDLPLTTGIVIDDLNYKHWDQFVQTIPHIFLAKVTDGILSEQKDILEGEPFECPVLPFGGTEQFCWSPDGKCIAYTSRKKTGTEYAISTDTDIFIYNIEDGSTTNVCKPSNYEEPAIGRLLSLEGQAKNKSEKDIHAGYDQDPKFSPDGTKLAWKSMARDGYESDRMRLCVLDLKSGEQTYCTESFESGVEDFEWNKDSKSLYFVSVWQARIMVYKTNLKGEVSPLTTGDYDYGTIQLMPNGKQLLANRHSISAPDDLYLINLEGKKEGEATQITQENKDILSQLSFGKVEERWIGTTDGLKELCWIIYPPHFDKNKKHPTLLFCEGGPQSPVSQFWSYRWNFQIMAANGYIIVAPNRRGLPGFGMEWLEEISGDYSGQCMRDYLSAIDEVAKEPYVDKDKLGCVGASFGGYSVYWLAGNHEKRFKAFIAHDGIFNTQQQYYETEEMWFLNWDLEGAPEKGGNAYGTSPHLYVDKWDTPILCIHGEKDYRILHSQGQAAFSAARMHGVPAQLLLFPDENHWVLKPQNGILWQRTFFRWLDKWLK